MAQFVMRKRRASCSALPSNTPLTAALSMTAVPWCGLLCVVLCRAPPWYHSIFWGIFLLYIPCAPTDSQSISSRAFSNYKTRQTPPPHTTHSLAELLNTENGR